MTHFDYQFDCSDDSLHLLDLSSTDYGRRKVSHLYRCERYEEDGAHAGYRFFRTLHEAKQEARHWPQAQITRVIYSPGKDALMHILNHLGGHPNNG